MNLSLIIDLEYFQFGPPILGIYILVLQLLKKLQFGLWFVSGQNWWWFKWEISVWLCIYSLVLQFW
jgi:hypothetical protein